MSIEPAAGFAPHHLVVNLPPELQVDSVVLHLRTGIEAIIDELEGLHRYDTADDSVREVDGRMARYLLGQVRDGVGLAKERLRSLLDDLGSVRERESKRATERLQRGIADLGGVTDRLALRGEIGRRLTELLQGWRSVEEAWRDRPVAVERDEPRDEPWASLVGPEGVVLGRVLADQLGGAFGAPAGGRPGEDDD